MPKPAAITFIICTYNRADYLDDTLRSLLECEAPCKQTEILVIDNNSEDHTRDVVQKYIPKMRTSISIRIERESRQGLSHARNRGIREARSPVVVFVDDDIRAEKDYINAWLRFFEDHPRAKAAGGKIHVQFDDPRPAWLSRYLLPLLGHHDLGDKITLYGGATYPFGGNMGFQIELFDRLDTFNADLGRIGKDLKASEEKELFQRLKKHGTDIYFVPAAKLWHRVNASRLTEEYIRRQAFGLGQSMALRFSSQSLKENVLQTFTEAGKWVATAGLFFAYLVILQPAKGIFLFRFRKWIAEGFTSSKSQNSNSDD